MFDTSSGSTASAAVFVVAVICLAPSPIGGAEVDSPTGNGECSGSGTYYIHEYHVHGRDDGSPTVAQPLFGRYPGRPDQLSYNETRYIEEKHKWLERFRELNDRLADERSRRLDIMTRLVSWISAVDRRGQRERPDRQVDQLKEMLIMWSDVEGWNYSRIIADDAGREENVTAEQSETDFRAELPAVGACAECNATLVDDLQRRVEGQQNELSSTKREIHKLNKRYLTTYTGYKKMVANVREIKRDLRAWEHRAGRLLRLYESQFGSATKDKADEGGLGQKAEKDSASKLRDEIKTLKRRVWCLEQAGVDPVLCPNIKKMSTTPAGPEQELTSSHTGNSAQESGPTLSLEGAVAANLTAYLQDSIVIAGKQITQWQEEQMKRKRPKDCSEIDYWFQRRDPVQVIYLEGRDRPVKALCDEGWTVIMKNKPYGENPIRWEQGASRKWEQYKYGFGAFEADLFWFGNQYIHELTNQADYQLRIDMIRAADSEKLFAEYAFFRLAEEQDGYRLAVGDNMGTAGDILGVHSPLPVDRQQFLTLDRRPDQLDNRLKFYREGWWYPTVDVRHEADGRPEPCFTHLTHEYPWICGRNGYEQLESVVMRIRPLRDGL